MSNLDTHIFIEFYYREGKKFLNEHNSKLSFKMLNESYGVFDGCYEIAKQIYAHIENKTLKNDETKKVKLHIENHEWIDSFEIIVYNDELSNVGASYDSSSQIKVYDRVQKFSPLRMSVNLSYGNIIVSIMHELTHAYDDYNRRIKGKPSINDRAKEIGYYSNKTVGNYDNEKKYISFILYYLTDFEVNAHLSQLKGELQNCDRYFASIKQIVNYIKGTDVCKRYEKIKTYIDFFSSVTNEESQRMVLSWVSELSNLKFKTYKNFVNYINDKYDKTERHMNRLIPKIAYEYLEYGNILNSFNGELSEIE